MPCFLLPIISLNIKLNDFVEQIQNYKKCIFVFLKYFVSSWIPVQQYFPSPAGGRAAGWSEQRAESRNDVQTFCKIANFTRIRKLPRLTWAGLCLVRSGLLIADCNLNNVRGNIKVNNSHVKVLCFTSHNIQMIIL